MTSRRDFLAGMTFGGVGSPVFTGAEMDRGDTKQQTDRGPGIHSVLDRDHRYIFIDSCMQIWPDAQLEIAHRHGVTAYGVTAWDPHADAATALEGLMYWHWAVREYPNLLLVETTEDIRRAKREGKAGLLLAAQDGDWIGLDLHRVQAFHDNGSLLVWWVRRLPFS